MKRFLTFFLAMMLLLSGCSMPSPAPNPPGIAPPNAADTFTVHYIDVGQADSILLECGSEYLLIDGGNVDDGDYVVEYLLDAGVEELAAVVATHAHEDHVGGLADVLKTFPTEAVYAPTRTYSSNCFDQFVYYTGQQDLTIRIPQPGDTIPFGNVTITVLGPVKNYADTNNTSIVLLAQFKENRFLFTGDMETLAETDLLDSGADVKADVLKVGHHGSETSTSYRFLWEVEPAYAVISVGKGNAYGHPHEAPMSRLEDAEVTVYRTDKLGTIIAVSDGKEVSFSWSTDQSAFDISGIGNASPTNSTAQTRPAQVHIGNVNSKVFHLPTCNSLPSEKNRIQFESYQEAIATGYRPCSRCLK